jgi:hypothetical protein
LTLERSNCSFGASRHGCQGAVLIRLDAERKKWRIVR